MTSATESAQKKAEEKVKEALEKTVSESINSMTGTEDAVFHEMFPNADSAMISEFKGTKINLPNGTPVFVFKYKADKEVLLPFLESQPASDESRSDDKVQKIDGQRFVSKISLLEKFLPPNTVDTSILDDIRNSSSTEFYRLKRFPNYSTLVYNPENRQFLHFVEVKNN